MAVLRKIFGTSIAIAVALTVSEPSSAFAQAGGAARCSAGSGWPAVPEVVDKPAAAEVEAAAPRCTPLQPVRRT